MRKFVETFLLGSIECLWLRLEWKSIGEVSEVDWVVEFLSVYYFGD